MRNRRINFFIQLAYLKDIFDLKLNDDSNEIIGKTSVTVAMLEEGPFALDLISKIQDYGMTVSKVSEEARIINYSYTNNKIKINPSHSEKKERTFTINYHGTPEKGLVIDTTKFGQRSFFGDNWPNLARHWLPSVDHPYDKE